MIQPASVVGIGVPTALIASYTPGGYIPLLLEQTSSLSLPFTSTPLIQAGRSIYNGLTVTGTPTTGFQNFGSFTFFTLATPVALTAGSNYTVSSFFPIQWSWMVGNPYYNYTSYFLINRQFCYFWIWSNTWKSLISY